MAVPTLDSELVPYGRNLEQQITARIDAYRLTPEQVDRYLEALTPYLGAANAVVEARASGVRSTALTAKRDQLRGPLLRSARYLYSTIRDDPDVSDEDKELAGIVVPSPNTSPDPAPATPPNVDVLGATRDTISVGLRGTGSPAGSRRKPRYAAAAWVYSFAGEEYPADPMAWTFHGAATGDKFTLTFGEETPAGQQVWVMAFYVNRRGVGGPPSTPVTGNLQVGGVATRAAAAAKPAKGGDGKLKIAA